jgi:GST-like protein
MIDFYYSPTPNGWKVAIMLEECAFDYETHLLMLTQGDQFSDEFLKISPNAKMPAIVDNDVDGEPVSVFESGAILFYLAEKAGRFMPTDALGRKETLEWLFWQVGNQGPLAGQLSHFTNYAPEGQDYGLKRYTGEYERNLAVIENRLGDREYLLGDYSIVDMISFPWVLVAKGLGVSLDGFPNVLAWRSRIKTRPAVEKAVNLFKQTGKREDNAQNNSLLFNQNASHLLKKQS